MKSNQSNQTHSKQLSRHDMFIRLEADQVNRFPNNSLTWCHRGDKYVIDDDQQLPQLIRMFAKHYPMYKVAMIRDNTKAANDPNRIVLKYCNGVLEINNLINYSDVLYKTILPSWLRG